jgi:HAD superfamily hydrolase (TIGR01459 family)
MIEVLKTCTAFLSNYPALICDVWGVLHDGVTAYPESNAALTRYREQGGKVVLLSNSPQVSWQIEALLERKGIWRSTYDALVTSGDLTIQVVGELKVKRVCHIGPERHAPLYENQPYARVDFKEAEAIVCTGFYNDNTEELESYMPMLQKAAAAGLPFVCGNPDVVVDVGGTLVLCAGAIAERYVEMGGKVIWAGKPKAMAYSAAQKEIDALNGAPLPKHKILALGDALETDMRGAQDYGIDRLFIAQGIHREEVAPEGRIDAVKLKKLFLENNLNVTAASYNLK